MRAVSALLSLLLALYCARPACARDERSLVSLVEKHLLARGASKVTPMLRTFLFEGESKTREDQLGGSGCIGYLAIGTGEVRDIDLGLYTRAGQPLAEDVTIAPFAYARGCGDAGLKLYVSVSMYAGRGELTLFRIENAPRELDRLPASIPFAVSAGGRLESAREVGLSPDEVATDSALLQEERALAKLGYIGGPPASAFELRAGVAEGTLMLLGGRCYRVVGLVPLSRGVALEVEGPRSEEWAARASSDERVSVAVCAKMDGMYRVRVQARPLRGTAIVRAFEHPEAHARDTSAQEDAKVLALAEASTVAAARGFALSRLGEAWVEGSVSHVWPISLAAGRCYAIAVVADGGPGAVDMRLTDEQGVLLARNEGRRGVPMVFACPPNTVQARLVLRARGPDSKMGVWLGASEVSAP